MRCRLRSIGHDLNPKTHLTMGTVSLSFEPVWLGGATGRGRTKTWAPQRILPSAAVVLKCPGDGERD
jgi:hypothetical protein